MGNFFGSKKKSTGQSSGGGKSFGGTKKFGGKKKEALGEYVSFGAAWLLDIGGELPGISVRMSRGDLENIIKLAETTDDNSVGFMMFPNRNQREGKSDPDYNLVPHKDDRHVFENEEGSTDEGTDNGE